jgi:hypothetical protein
LRGKRFTSSGSAPGSAIAAAARSSAAVGSGALAGLIASRTQSAPKKRAITAPTITAGVLTTMPASMQAMPTAKPTGQMLGDGR